MSKLVGVSIIEEDGTLLSAHVPGSELVDVMRSGPVRRGDVTQLRELMESNGASYDANPLPAKFGFMLVDLEQRKIMDWQSFFGIKTVGDYELGLGVAEPSDEAIELRSDLSDALTGASYYSRKSDTNVPLPLEGALHEDLYYSMKADITARETIPPAARSMFRKIAQAFGGGDLPKQPTGASSAVIRFDIDFPAWDYVDLRGPTDPSGGLAIRDSLRKRGLLTDETLAVWNNDYGNRMWAEYGSFPVAPEDAATVSPTATPKM